MSENPAFYISAADTQRKIYKAIYLILRKYHALYGLEIFVFSGGHGAGYVSFQLACDRIRDADRLETHYPSPPLRQPTAFVTFYLTHFGIPAWATANNEQVDMPPAHYRAPITWLTGSNHTSISSPCSRPTVTRSPAGDASTLSKRVNSICSWSSWPG